MKTPVLFLVFNRPDTTIQVFEKICNAKPSRLYVACDGPRINNLEDKGKIEIVQNIIAKVDWPCEVKTLYREKNLGCKIAVSEAITWFFNHEEQGIILEDDCLPSDSFFVFCEELLNKYKYEDRIMHIAGMTYVEKNNVVNNYSYHFCKVGGIWGWASWRRAWKKYELEMSSYEQAIKENIFDNLFLKNSKLKLEYLNMFKYAYEQKPDTWDYQWTFTKIINNSINIMPAKNLIKNIGFDHKDATHTSKKEKKYTNMKLKQIKFPLNHPKFIVVDENFNYENFKYTQDSVFKIKLIGLLRIIIPQFVIKLVKILIK